MRFMPMPLQHHILGLFAALAAIPLVLLAPTSGPAAEIHLRRQATLAGPIVRLADVAEILSADPSEAARLGAIELGPLPSSRQATLQARDLWDRLVQAGVDPARPSRGGATRMTLTRRDARPDQPAPPAVPKRSLQLAETTLREAIVRYLAAQVPAENEWQVEFTLSDDQAALLQSTGRSLRIAGGQSPWTGSQSFEVTVPPPAAAAAGTAAAAQSTSPPPSFTLAANVTLPGDVVVAAGPLRKGDTFRPQDVALKRVPGARSGKTYHSLEEVIGREAIRNVAPGQVLDPQYVALPLWVRKGDVVEVISRAGPVKIRTKGRARKDGGEGELIDVELLDNRKALSARVSGLQEVEVLAAAPTPARAQPLRP